jgi:zeaxanthin glucosyltransferase
MRTVLFIILPFTSHFYPMISMAEEYRSKGYRVVFTTAFHSKGMIEQNYFECRVVNYLEETLFNNLKSFLGFTAINLLTKKHRLKKFKEFIRVKNNFENVIEEVKPDKIYLEANMPEYLLFIKRYDIPTETVGIYLSTKKTYGIPPLTSSFIPTGSFASNIYSEYLWAILLLKQKMHSTLDYLANIGLSDIYIEKRICKKNHWTWNAIFSTNHAFHIGCKGLNHNIISSPELEYEAVKSDTLLKFYNNIRSRNESNLRTEAYKELKFKIQSLQKSGMKCIYASFGTWSNSKVESFQLLRQNLIEVVNENSNYILLFTNSGKVENQSNYIYTLTFAPQLDILKYADLMITHAGLGSINECLENKVRMIAIPLNKALDQPGNAARLSSKGLATELMLNSSKHQLKEAIQNELLKSYHPNHESSYVYN